MELTNELVLEFYGWAMFLGLFVGMILFFLIDALFNRR